MIDEPVQNIVNGNDVLRVILFDWDDTLFPTTWLSNYEHLLDDPTMDKSYISFIYQSLQKIEQNVYKLFEEILNYCSIFYIITNAESGWVEYTSSKYMPFVFNFILSNLDKIKIISARSNNSIQYPNCHYKWKLIEITNILSTIHNQSENYFSASRKHVISFGDNTIEKEATKEVTSVYPNIITKTIKFIDTPTCDQLVEQLEHVYTKLSYIINGAYSIDMLMDNFCTNLYNCQPQNDINKDIEKNEYYPSLEDLMNSFQQRLDVIKNALDSLDQ